MASDAECRTITELVHDQCEDRSVTPLVVRDVGSRAMGTESRSSDYDVMFVYLDNPQGYLLSEGDDTIEATIGPLAHDLDTEVEIDGWNFAKFARALRNSDPNALELVGSEEEYYRNDRVGTQLDRLFTYTAENFKPYALLNHYRSLAANNYGKYIESGWTLADGASWQEFLDLNPINDMDTANVRVDEQSSSVHDNHVDVVSEMTMNGTSRTTISEAIENDLVRRTNTDRSIKRYLNILDALARARIVERTHDLPPIKTEEVLYMAESMPDDVYEETMAIVARKRQGRGSIQPTDRQQELFNDYIEDELARDVPAQTEDRSHVEQHVDRERFEQYVSAIAVTEWNA